MDQIAYDEIVSVLAMFGRPDLIQEFKDNVSVDEDYVPKLTRRDSLSDSELHAVRAEFEPRWNGSNRVRTWVASAVSLLFIILLLRQ